MLGTPDFIIITIILASILIGVVRGFIKESISLVTWVIAICLAVLYAAPLSAHITFTKIELVRSLSAFLIIFILTVFVGALINYLVGGFIRKTPFSMPDRVLGSAFGLLRGVVLVTILVLVAGLTPLPEEEWWQQSKSISHFQVFAMWLKEQLPEENAKAFHFPLEGETQAKR